MESKEHLFINDHVKAFRGGALRRGYVCYSPI